MKKTVIFGGTFNPPHFGHVKLMEEVIAAVRPDRFILMPTHLPPHKAVQELMSDEDRLEMCRLMAKSCPIAEVSDYEISAGGKSYTVRTLEHFHELYPDDELYFAMGSDMLISFFNWYMPKRITELAVLVCNCRNAMDREACEAQKKKIEQIGGRCILTSCEPLVCSSTDVRERIDRNEPITGLVPPAVAEYIEKRGLYRD